MMCIRMSCGAVCYGMRWDCTHVASECKCSFTFSSICICRKTCWFVLCSLKSIQGMGFRIA